MNALSPIAFNFLPNCTHSRNCALKNVVSAIDVTLSGMTTLLSALPRNESTPIVASLVGSAMCSSSMQSSKAPFPRLVTVAGIVTAVMFSHSKNA